MNMQQKKWKPPIEGYIFIYLIANYFGIQISSVIVPGDDIIAWYNKWSDLIETKGNFAWGGWNGKYTLTAIFIITLVVGMYVLLDMTKNRNYMPGIEHGSAKWVEAERITKKFADLNNIHCNRVYSQNVKIGMDGDKTRINNNTFVIGGSGAGKSFFLLTPNVYQASPDSKFPGSYVFTDPKGELLQKNGKFLQSRGYKIRVLNLTTEGMAESDCFNPFEYIRRESDIDKLITNLFANTTDKNASKGDPFWEKAEMMFLQSLFLFVWMEGEKYGYPKNFNSVMDLLNLEEVYDDEDKISPLGLLFEKLVDDTKGNRRSGGKKHPAYVKYKKTMCGAADTKRSILISANARISILDNNEVRRLLEKDELNLPSLGTGKVDGKENVKTALFCVIPDSDTTYNCIAGMMYTLLFQELYAEADKPESKGKLNVPVTFWLDEFANIALPENFTKLLATMRSRLISSVIIIQNLAQIKKMYEKDWEVLPGNCDTLVYLGGNEQSTFEYISKNLGKCTIWKKSRSKTMGKNGSSSNSEDILGRELMTPDEVGKLDNSKCIIFVRGEGAILDDKFHTLESPHFDESVKLGTYVHLEEKNKQADIKPISPQDFAKLEKQGKTLDIVITEEQLKQYGSGTPMSDDDLAEYAALKDDRDDIDEFESEIYIDISDLSVEEVMAIEELDLSEDELSEVCMGIENGLSDDEIKSYILYGNAKRMRAKRMTLEAFAKRKERNKNTEVNG